MRICLLDQGMLAKGGCLAYQKEQKSLMHGYKIILIMVY